MKLVVAIVFMAHLADNGEAATIRACVADCGGRARVVITDDWESEGVSCECVETENYSE